MRHYLVEENTELITQGIELIESLAPEIYRRNEHEHFSSGVGRHFRHVLDFYDRLLSGRSSTVDYESRRRDERVETDPDYAVRAARTICGALRELVRDPTVGGAAPDEPVRVRTEIHGERSGGIQAASTLERELAVLASHTVHHYAIIALVLRILGVHVPQQFGVAPSTLRYLASQEP